MVPEKKKKVSARLLWDADDWLAAEISIVRILADSLKRSTNLCMGREALSDARELEKQLRSARRALERADEKALHSPGYLLNMDQIMDLAQELREYEAYLETADVRFANKCSCMHRSSLRKIL